jgi:hypothetical protein
MRFDQQPAISGSSNTLSLRCVAGEGVAIPIAGMAIRGASIPALLVRGVGPALREFGVSNAMEDPKLRMYRGEEFLFEIDNWRHTVVGYYLVGRHSRRKR